MNFRKKGDFYNNSYKKLDNFPCFYIISHNARERERKKAISSDDYGTALVATIFEGIFKEAEKS